MKRTPLNGPDDDLDALFRTALRRELAVPAPIVGLPQSDSRYQPIEPPERRLLGGGPGGMPYSGFYLVFYVSTSSRPAWGTIPG